MTSFINSLTRLALFLLSAVALTAAFAAPANASGDHGHGHDEHHEEETPRGPHGGRLLERDDFALEVTIFEAGVPPEFRVYAYEDHEPVAPHDVGLQIELHRLGGDKDTFEFTPAGEYLRGGGTVTEPHSFDVHVHARYQGQTYEWAFESHEGRTRIADEAAREAGVRTETAGPARLRRTVTLYGTVRPDEERVSRLAAPYAGSVQQVTVSVGDTVEQGEVLARIQSSESLEVYTLTAPHDGVIISRHANPGELTGDEALLVLADLSVVWVDFAAFPGGHGELRVGQPVQVHGTGGNNEGARAELLYIAPVGSSASQSVLVRAELDNREGRWRPGLLVTGEVTVAEADVPLAVKTSALQTFRDFTVVFARFGEMYEVRMPELGRRDGDYVEVLGGLEPGTEYVTANSYLIKADILKSGAAHHH